MLIHSTNNNEAKNNEGVDSTINKRNAKMLLVESGNSMKSMDVQHLTIN